MKCLLLLLSVFRARSLLPVPELRTAPSGTWPAPLAGGAYFGDVRAMVQLGEGDITNDEATAQVFWRRRDPFPFNKSVLVLDASHAPLTVTALHVEADCGVITFSRAGLAPGTYYIYYLPFKQGSGGAWLTFSWQGCSDQTANESNVCVQGRRLGARGDGACAAVDPAAPPVAIENRDEFNAFSVMEQMATRAETASAAAALTAAGAPFVGVFPEPRELSVRVFDAGIPVRWVPGGDGPQPSGAPFTSVACAPGEFCAFQLGLWAYMGAVANVTYSASAFLNSEKALIIPAAAFTILNLEGSDVFGAPFENTGYALPAGGVGSLWCGLAVPANASAGAYRGTVTLTSGGAIVAVTVTFAVDGAPVPFGGAGNLSSMARLAWLNSERGLEDVVPSPFVPVTGRGGGGSALVVTSLNKVVAVGADGLPAAVNTTFNRVRLGAAAPVTHALLSAPVTFTLMDAAGMPATPVVTSPAAITVLSNSSVAWEAEWGVALGSTSVTVAVAGVLDFTSYLNFEATIFNGGSVAAALGDVQLSVPVSAALLGWIVGMENNGAEAAEYADRNWRWSPTTGANKMWVGRPEAGVLLNLKGDGIEWDSPMFGKDYPIIPFIPPTWGGVDVTPGATGVNCSQGRMTAFSGPRTLAPGENVTFKFDLALTPSKPVNWTRHWATRTRQLGYDVPYASPEDVAALGVTVVTLHQGTPGIVNGSLINPWINYPFLDDTVPLLSNYSSQANALGMGVKMYYTIRELSSRAVEMFAFKAMQGEILVDQDPYDIVQPGYAHAWNTHGGAAYLHQHMVTHYGACWQQSESNGEWDPSMCSRGVSRLFNYYVEGLYWSFMQPPFMTGIYYDGTNFPREGMIRIRRAADAASEAAGKGFPALLDLHTGREGTPDICSYATHYPLMDYVWNGEGFDWNARPAYWLIETSALIHGLSGDMLGSGEKSVFRGMVFGMTQRDLVSSQAMWKFWDAARIHEATALYGWWDADGTPAVVVHSTPAPPAPQNCSWEVAVGSYWGANNEECLPVQPGVRPGCYQGTDLTAVKAACCADVACAGFSFSHAAHNGDGCCKSETNEKSQDPTFDGFRKPGWAPPAGGCNGTTGVLATTWSSFRSHAVVAVATWCPATVNATLVLDWAALGLDAATASVTLPAIAGVQAAATLPSAEGPFEIPPDGGLLMLIAAPGFELGERRPRL